MKRINQFYDAYITRKFSLLIFLGTLGCAELTDELIDAGGLPFVRQLLFDTLVAVVDMLRILELLYLVNADVDAPALDEVELRQLVDTIELALDATVGCRELRALLGDKPRLLPLLRSESGDQCSALGWGLDDTPWPRRPRLRLSLALIVVTGRRPETGSTPAV